MVEDVCVKVRVDSIRFRNESNGYSVLDTTDEDGGELVVVGSFPYIEVGMMYEFTGNYSTHKSYGEQFSAISASAELPKGESEIERYLASGAIKGIGKKRAKIIVEAFGENTLEIISNDPEKLATIPGIGKKRAEEICEDYQGKQGITEIGIFLQKYDMSPVYALKLFRKYGVSAVEVLKNRPYECLSSIGGIAFKKIDDFALALGIEKNDFERIKSGVVHILNRWASEGHTYIPKNELLNKAALLLELTSEEIEQELTEMVFSGKIKIELINGAETVFLWRYYEAEQSVCKKLLTLSRANISPLNTDIEQIISILQNDRGIKLSENQKNAVKTSVESGVSIVTGGPGTGKTTILEMIIGVLEAAGQKVMIAAPTGRAAKRITEATGYSALTIHRMLEYYYSEESGTMRFGKNSDEPLETDAVIIDEASMIDIILMQALMDAVSSGTRMIFVGDADQLPPVGAGNVLSDMLFSEILHSVMLTEIFRQAKESMIVVNAHRINKGEYPYYNEKDKDFFLLESSNEKDIVNKIKELCVRRLPAYYRNCCPLKDIQVITPTRKGVLGSVLLNTQLQSVLNPKSKEKREYLYMDRVFREGDRVMQMRNNYNQEWKKPDEAYEGQGVFNGEVGYIKYIDTQESVITVEFDDGKLSDYDALQLEELELAYALTVHKSQGSEFPIVVIPSSWFPPLLATRNLLYTAVTRGRQVVVIVGSKKHIEAMIENNEQSVRNTALGVRLKKYGRVIE